MHSLNIEEEETHKVVTADGIPEDRILETEVASGS